MDSPPDKSSGQGSCRFRVGERRQRKILLVLKGKEMPVGEPGEGLGYMAELCSPNREI